MFQKKVIEKYLSKIDSKTLLEKYIQYCSIFANKQKQENIRNSKEEQYQEGFIRDLFCSVLGYTIKPEANYNILTELKNESKSNSKKSDAAIIINNEVKAVIELKGTDTQDLDKVAFQAFSYKNHHEKCNYVIVSNFERLRLYVETQIEFTEFNLFKLTKEDFDLLYLLLSLDNISSDVPLKLKHETLTEEIEITNAFYADYSTFKRVLFEDLIENNPDIDKLLLFKKTQKLLDRLLFVMFCEDRNLLPTNSTLGIINDYKKLKEMGYYQPLYNYFFKVFFEKIDKGFTHEVDHSKDIFAYNGGLFKPDEILDNIKVSDKVLLEHCSKLANYDFASQISVDILGRIFENSLTEIEEVQNEIENEKNGIKQKSSNIGKRKKDGVFYTPEYITKYIVENTIGKLCEEKKNELKINDTEFTFDKKYQKKKINELDERLNKYRKWLLSLKILDCACGSGAFLNAALRELKKEHTLIDYFWSKIHKGELNFTQIDNTILENNLYGVDINDDSIEITKLSLWLHTATKNRKLTTLNDKIKCGNSLIDDESVAGDKAFDWEREFPEVFAYTPRCSPSLAGAAAKDGGVQASDRRSASRRAAERSEAKGVFIEKAKTPFGSCGTTSPTCVGADLHCSDNSQLSTHNSQINGGVIGVGCDGCDCPKASGEDALKLSLEGENKREGDRIRSKASSVEQPSSQADSKNTPLRKGRCHVVTERFSNNQEKISLSAKADIPLYKRGSLGDYTGDSNTLTLNKVSSSSVTTPSAKADTPPQVGALGQHCQTSIQTSSDNSQLSPTSSQFAGGFDVIIGNPPYGAKFSKNEITYFEKNYQYQSYQLDSYLIFVEKIGQLLKPNGHLGLIMPNTWLSTVFSTNIRKYVFENYSMKKLRHYHYFVFPEATVETDIYILIKDRKVTDNNIEISFIKNDKDIFPKTKIIPQREIIAKNGLPINIYESKDFESIKLKCQKLKTLGDLFQIVQGTKPFQKGKGTPPQTEETLKSQIFIQEFKKDDSYLPCLRGSLINRYANFWNNNYYISYGDWLAEPRYSAKFNTKEKLLIRQTGDSIISTYDNKQFIARDNLYVLRDDEGNYSLKTLLAILNSRFITWYYQNFINPEVGKTLAQVKRTHLLQLPIPDISKELDCHGANAPRNDGYDCPKASPRGLPPRKAACMRATGGQRVAEVDCQRQDGEVNEFVVNSESMKQSSSQAKENNDINQCLGNKEDLLQSRHPSVRHSSDSSPLVEPLEPHTTHHQSLITVSQLSDLADKMLSLNADLQKKITRFISRIKETYGFEKTTQNIENFYKLTFTDFVKELLKVKVKLTMKQKDELEDYFNDYVKDISALNAQIGATDNEINKLVYKLYNLTEEEIKIIERE